MALNSQGYNYDHSSVTRGDSLKCFIYQLLTLGRKEKHFATVLNIDGLFVGGSYWSFSKIT